MAELTITKDREELERQKRIDDAISQWAINLVPFKPTKFGNTPERIKEIGNSLREIRDRRLHREINSDFYIYCAGRFGMRPDEVDYYINYPGMAYKASGDIPKQQRDSFVYFLMSGDLIKIGVTVDVQKRVGSIKTMSPVPVELLGFIKGDKHKESSLHERFSSTRAHGEWFKKTNDLLTFIKETCHE